jgi:hypothetical protein
MSKRTGSRSRRILIRTLPAIAPIALMCLFATATSQAGPSLQQSQDLVPVLNGLLQKYNECIIEREDPRNDATCIAKNKCSLAYRKSTLAALQVQANNGDPTNFAAKLQSVIINDCFLSDKEKRWLTKHDHCYLECNGDNGIIKGPCFEACQGRR